VGDDSNKRAGAEHIGPRPHNHSNKKSRSPGGPGHRTGAQSEGPRDTTSAVASPQPATSLWFGLVKHISRTAYLRRYVSLEDWTGAMRRGRVPDAEPRPRNHTSSKENKAKGRGSQRGYGGAPDPREMVAARGSGRIRATFPGESPTHKHSSSKRAEAP
jgi:hypothetical protein